MKILQKATLVCVLLSCLVVSPLIAQGNEEKASTEAWPNDTVTFVLNAQAGSGSDLVARIFADFLEDTTGQSFVIKNDTSGNSTIAYETVANAKKDGTTIGFFNNQFLQYHGGVYRKNPWDIFDVAAIGPYGQEGFVLVGHPDAPYQTIEELIAYAKENPNSLKSGIQNRSVSHFVNEILNANADITMNLVESGSSADKIAGILGGYLDIGFVYSVTAAQYVEAGQLNAYILAAPERSKLIPGVPTGVELGYPDLLTDMAMPAFFVPKGTDPTVIEAINSAIAGIENDENAITQLQKLRFKYIHANVQESIDIIRNSEEIIKKSYELIL